MKVVATVAVIVVFSVATSGQNYSDEERKRILKNREDCVAETKVDPELIDRADKGDFVDDDKLKCFTKCFYQKAGFVTETGDLLIETIKAKIPSNIDKEKALEIIEKCKQKGKDACETVYLVHKCYFEHTHIPEPEKQPEIKSEPAAPEGAATNVVNEKENVKEDKNANKTENQGEAKKL
uniref:Odorant binding protein 24 n=1 Tax=Xylotrechus quadripes TaxID=554073 RepID=A0A346HGP6_9CUCU|nr:odorant binding protein 24 [Xylotrechus quadripes]